MSCVSTSKKPHKVAVDPFTSLPIGAQAENYLGLLQVQNKGLKCQVNTFTLNSNPT